MNKDVLSGKWHELIGRAKLQWGKLTDDDLAQVKGQAEKLVGLIQQRYGYDRDRARQEVDGFVDEYLGVSEVD